MVETQPLPHDDSTALWGTTPMRWALRMLELRGRTLTASFNAAQTFQAAEFLAIELHCPIPLDELMNALLAAVPQCRESTDRQKSHDGLLQWNLRLLEQTMGLTSVEQDLIAFRVMLRMHPGFAAIAEGYVSLCPDCVLHRRLAELFEVPVTAVVRALEPEGNLVRSGLVAVTSGLLDPFFDRLRLLRGLISPLFMRHASATDLMRALLPPRRDAHLGLRDYPHLAEEVRLLRDYLAVACTERRTGVNVLLHGEPGAGKTELTAALAQSVGRQLYELRAIDGDEGQLTPRDRLMALALAQRLAQTTEGALILVDEAEDLFATPWSDPDKTPTKAALNHCLESTPTPTIWISNRTQHVEEAFLRRFDLVIHVTPLPTSAKCELLRRELPATALSDAAIRAYAEQPRQSPAVLSRMARVACSAANGSPEAVRRNLGVLSRHYLQTMGEAALPSTDHAPLLEHDLSLLNTDIPLESVLATMQHTTLGARMLLSGPPGTGKTALGKALAQRLDKPLLQRQASSLLSAYVGGTEHNLRRMFAEARQERGVLLLDEADSFLSSRDGARARWEVTQTNELLTQMEAFEGIFICTTNRLDQLDPACMRRFDLKVAFRPLREDQRAHLLHQCCARLGIVVGDVETRDIGSNAARLANLTPGDAVAALRRLRLAGSSPTLEQLVAALADECRGKVGTSRPIGFVQ